MYRKAVRTQVGCKRKVRQQEEKWLVIPDHHEAVVSRELFKKARQKNYQCVADLVERYGTSEALTEEFMRDMVEKVLVYEDKRIEIIWKYRDEFEELS